MLRFAGFELDPARAELRAVGGEAIKLRPKTFALLQFFAGNPNRLLSKQELMSAIWPNIHVGEDSLFQCIKELRAALRDEQRLLVKSVSGRGYLFNAEIVLETDRPSGQSQNLPALPPAAIPKQSWLKNVRRPVLASLLILCLAVGMAIAAPILMRRLYTQELQTIAVMPIEARSSDPATAAMAKNVTDRLTDGLSKIGNVRVIAARGLADTVSASSAQPNFVLQSDLQRGLKNWEIQARLLDSASGQVQWTTTASVSTENIDETLQQSRLAAGIGYPLALRLNASTHSRLPSADSKIVVEQAAAFINQTSRERFAAAQTMLEKALVTKPGDVDLEAALAAHLLRGIQTVWYPATDVEKIEQRARGLLEDVLKREPNYIPGLQGYCRFLMTTNYFADSLVACEKNLAFQPWDGLALFQMGISQLRLGFFEDALATFRRADSFDTPQVSRWTWLLGVGFAFVMLDRAEEALPWLERSIAITPGTGRTHLLMVVAYQSLGRTAEAKSALAKMMELRPGTTIENSQLPHKNESERYRQRSNQIAELLSAAGLPRR